MLAFNTATFFDIRHQCISFSMDFYDVFSAFVVTILSLSWSAWISVAIAIVATAATLHSDFAAGSLEEIFPFFMYIVLPLLLTLSYVCDTRTRAATHLAVLKSMCTALCLGRPEGGTDEAKESAEQMQMAVEILIKDVHAYLAHKRPYARHFFIPYRVNRVTATHTLVRHIIEDARLTGTVPAH